MRVLERMTMLHRNWIWLVVSALLGAPAMAQMPAKIDSGARVRVHATGSTGAPVVGTFVAARADSIIIAPERDPLRAQRVFSRTQVLKLEISRTPRSRFSYVLESSLAGLTAGTMLGFAVSVIIPKVCIFDTPEDCDRTHAREQRDLRIGAGVVGLVGGAIVGFLRPARERWKAAAVPASP